MTARRRAAVSLGAALAAAAGPAAFGAWLARAPETVVSVPPAVLLTVAAQVPPGALDAASLAAGAALGTLQVTGDVTVARPGGALQLTGRAYAYPGGERIDVGADGLAALRVPGAGTVFVCPGSSAMLSRGDDGRLAFSLASGTARLVFDDGQAPAIAAGRRALEPRLDVAADGPFAAEVMVANGEVVVLPIGHGVGGAPGTAPVHAGQPWRAVAGDRNLWSLAENGASAADRVDEPVALPLPAAVTVAEPADAAAADLTGGGDYLCRLPDLYRAARALLSGAEPLLPPAAPPLAVPPAPEGPGAPPPAPELALVAPSDADVFDPNLLPAPAAGPPQEQVVVPAESIPVPASGGGVLGSAD